MGYVLTMAAMASALLGFAGIAAARRRWKGLRLE
jgi:uncharacterized membrane protein YtjA (UPF0391 family)